MGLAFGAGYVRLVCCTGPKKRDEAKTQELFIEDLPEMRQRIAELEAVVTEQERVEAACRDSGEPYRTLGPIDEPDHVADRELRLVLPARSGE